MPNTPNIKQRIIETYGQEPATMDELARCVICMIESYKYPHRYGKTLKQLSSPKVVGFAWNLSHGTVSNSHSAPLSGVTNFSRNRHYPLDYPGWRGRVWIRYHSKLDTFGSDPFSNTLTYVGTGSFGSYGGPWSDISTAQYRNNKQLQYPEPQVYSWDYRLYDSDWPLVTANLEKQTMIDTIQEGRLMNFKPHHFRWTDPQTLSDDQEYLNAVQPYSLNKYKNELI